MKLYTAQSRSWRWQIPPSASTPLPSQGSNILRSFSSQPHPILCISRLTRFVFLFFFFPRLTLDSIASALSLELIENSTCVCFCQSISRSYRQKIYVSQAQIQNGPAPLLGFCWLKCNFNMGGEPYKDLNTNEPVHWEHFCVTITSPSWFSRTLTFASFKKLDYLKKISRRKKMMNSQLQFTFFKMEVNYLF